MGKWRIFEATFFFIRNSNKKSRFDLHRNGFFILEAMINITHQHRARSCAAVRFLEKSDICGVAGAKDEVDIKVFRFQQ
ncbi:MAG: hypothetical protein ACI9XO_003447 [Paraglaciecola sp.]